MSCLLWMCLESWKFECPALSYRGTLSSGLQDLQGSAAACMPLTEERSSSMGEGHPLAPSTQLQEGPLWSSEGGKGHLPSQLDQRNQPW